MASKGYDSDRDVNSDEDINANNAAQYPIGIVRKYKQRYEDTGQYAVRSKLITPSLQDKFLEDYNPRGHNAQNYPDTSSQNEPNLRQIPNQSQNFTNQGTFDHSGNYRSRNQRQAQNLTQQNTSQPRENDRRQNQGHPQNTRPDTSQPRENDRRQNQGHPQNTRPDIYWARENDGRLNQRRRDEQSHQDTSQPRENDRRQNQGPPQNTRPDTAADRGNHRRPYQINRSKSAQRGSFEGWDRPKLWIQSHKNCTYTVDKETDAELRKIKEELVIVSIVGPYRTGKSYLMNLIAERKSNDWHCNGFKVGNTIKAETKGIWILCVPHPEKENTVLALLDSEGFGDVMKVSGEHESNILLLNILLSSTLLYNSIGVLDANSIKQLQYVANMASKVTVDDGSLKEVYASENALALVFPSFVWVLRDFQLDLDGKPPNKYLEEALRAQAGNGTDIALSNAARDSISRSFPSRKCICVPPLEFPNANVELRKLVAYIIKNTTKKRIEELPVNGKALAELAKCYTYKISTKAQIVVLNVWGNVLCEHFNDVYKQAVDIFERKYTSDLAYQDARFAASNHLVEQKCYDFRFLNQLMMYMKERKSGKTRVNAQTHATVDKIPSGDNDKTHLKEFLELDKIDTMPPAFMRSIIQTFEMRLDESKKKMNDLIDHFKRELEIAKEDPRKYRQEHLNEFNNHLKKEMNDSVSALTAKMDYLSNYTR